MTSARATWRRAASLSESALQEVSRAALAGEVLLGEAASERYLSMVEFEGHVQYVCWRVRPNAIPVEMKDHKGKWVPEATARLIQKDYSSAFVIHPKVVKFDKLKAYRQQTPTWARQLQTMWQLCVDVRSDAAPQGVHCFVCEGDITCLSAPSHDEQIDHCPFCTLSAHAACANALARHISKSSDDAADSPIRVPKSPPAGLSETAWAINLCAVCGECLS